MANVTQKIPNVIGGVSRVPDFDKTPGELREAVNCYPDLAYGMTKRPGSEYVGNLLSYTDTQADGTYFFPLIREGQPRYLVGVSSTGIQMWDVDDPDRTITVTETSDSFDYLALASTEANPYRHASDDRRTVIVNRTKVCQETTNTWEVGLDGNSDTNNFEWTPRKQNLNNNSIDDLPDGRAVRVNWGSGGNSSQTNPLRPGIHYLPLSVAESIEERDSSGTPTGREIPIKSQGYGAVLKANIVTGGTIPLKGVYRNVSNDDDETETLTEVFIEVGSDGTVPDPQSSDRPVYDAELWSAGSGYPDQVPMTIDGIEGSRCTLATGLLPAFVYRVVNSAASSDDFYMQAFSNSSTEDDTQGLEPGPRDRLDGPWFWKECPSPDSKIGLNETSLPHELVQTGTDAFEFRPMDYSYRWAGDDENNPSPSFVGKTINNIFFLNNRFGVLCEDNVILSRPINYGPAGTQPTDFVPDGNPWVKRNYHEIDFFRQSSISLNDADPIDMKAANNDVSIFHKVITTPQGVILFGDGQQSLLYQPQGLLSPLSASINSISNYDMTDDVMPIIVGETCYFVNKGANFCRIYSLVNQGMQNPAVITDVTKQVSDWLPNTLTDLRASLTDEMLLTYTRDSDTVYCRRVVNENVSAWTKWELPSPIVDLFVDHDEVFYLTKNNGRVTVHRSDMYVIGNDSSYVFAPRILTNEDFSGIPDDYDYSSNFIGYRQLSLGFTGQIEYYLPWHDYYEQGTQNQYNKWKPLGDLDGLNNAIATAVYPIQVDDSSPDKWNVGFRIQYKDADNDIITLPSSSTGSYIYLPYDVKFRINPIQTNASWLDGCVKTDICSRLQYIKTDGSLHDTDHWTNEIVEINQNSNNWVITLKDCDLDETYDVSLSSTDLYDVLLINISRNNCNTDPCGYQYARLVIDSATVTSISYQFYPHNTTYSPYTTYIDQISQSNSDYVIPFSRDDFPVKSLWFQKNSTPCAISTQAGGVVGNSGCTNGNVVWGSLDEFFCRQNPGKFYSVDGENTKNIYYNSSVNYTYSFSSNGGYDGSGSSYTDRTDVNGSEFCQFTGTNEQVGSATYVGKPWGSLMYVDNNTGRGDSWYPDGYYETGSGCTKDAFNGYYIGGEISVSNSNPDIGDWSFTGYQSINPPQQFNTAYGGALTANPNWTAEDKRAFWRDEIDTTGVGYFRCGFDPPETRNADPNDTNTPYTTYLTYHDHEPPSKIFIRCHYEFTNATEPYYGGSQAIYTDEASATCDSCPPNVLIPPEGVYKDLYISPYLDYYTDEVTLQSIDATDEIEATKKRLIIPPTNYPIISTAQPCLLIGILPDNTGTFTASDKAGYHVDITYDSTLGGFISPIDLTRFEGKVLIGYRYDFLIEMPKLFFMGQTSDYTASLTISRIKAAFGFSADATLQVRSTNNRAHFTKYFSATKPNLYDLDGSPITQSSIHALPVHRRTEDFYFRIASDSPFPLSVDSVTWEGNYSPRYYRRF